MRLVGLFGFVGLVAILSKSCCIPLAVRLLKAALGIVLCVCGDDVVGGPDGNLIDISGTTWLVDITVLFSPADDVLDVVVVVVVLLFFEGLGLVAI